MKIKFNNLFTEIHEHVKKKAMVFYGPNIGKIDDCIMSVINFKKKEDKKIDILYKYSDDLKPGEIENIITASNSPIERLFFLISSNSSIFFVIRVKSQMEIKIMIDIATITINKKRKVYLNPSKIIDPW